MTFSYTANPLHRTIDAIRAEIGDTIEREHLVEDEEVLYAYEKEGAILTAAARLCEMLAARFASKDSFRVSTATSTKMTVTAKYLEMAKYLRARGSSSGVAGSGGGFIMPSVSQAQKDLNAQDTDIPQPSFYRGLHKHPETATDVDSDSESGLN